MKKAGCMLRTMQHKDSDVDIMRVFTHDNDCIYFSMVHKTEPLPKTCCDDPGCYVAGPIPIAEVSFALLDRTQAEKLRDMLNAALDPGSPGCDWNS